MAELKSYVFSINGRTIHAKPMTRGAYNALRNWPADENPTDEGYLTLKTDPDALQNVPGFPGYVSWMPKSVFEERVGIAPDLFACGGLVTKSPELLTVPLTSGESFVPNARVSAITFGQKAVGLGFDPSGDPAVVASKRHYADAIDQLQMLRDGSTSQEQRRLASIAITETQAAQMWATKALTWKD